jgi:hypothetical protein
MPICAIDNLPQLWPGPPRVALDGSIAAVGFASARGEPWPRITVVRPSFNEAEYLDEGDPLRPAAGPAPPGPAALIQPAAQPCSWESRTGPEGPGAVRRVS